MEIKKTTFKSFFFLKKKLQSQSILSDSDNFLHPGLPQKMHVFSEKTFMDFPILDNYKNVQNAIYGKLYIKKKRRTFFLVLFFI